MRSSNRRVVERAVRKERRMTDGMKPPRTWPVAAIGLFCGAFATLFAAAAVLLGARVVWCVLHRQWQFIDLCVPAAASLLIALVLACCRQVLGLACRIASDLWCVRSMLAQRNVDDSGDATERRASVPRPGHDDTVAEGKMTEGPKAG